MFPIEPLGWLVHWASVLPDAAPVYRTSAVTGSVIADRRVYIMALATPSTPTRVKHKTFTYHTRLEWAGNKAGILHSEGKPDCRVASPPEFKGEAGVWTPEDMFVAAVDLCTMTTFVTFANRQQLPLVGYQSRTEGILEFVDGNYRFTKITLQPTIVVDDSAAVPEAEKILREAHAHCLIANSIKADVIIEPTIKSARPD
jgi:organic hydroperoxide reductase OsmC/OhrA